MAKRGWHIQRDETGVTIARHLPAQFDLCGETALRVARPVSRTRIAHQVRQDLWRALQHLRGFSPVVQVGQGDGLLTIRAGGRLSAATSQTAALRQLHAVLDDAANQQRWINHAGRGRHV